MGSFFLEISQETVNTIIKVVATAIGGILVCMGKTAIKYLKNLNDNMAKIDTKMEVMKTMHDAMDKRVTKLEDTVYER